MRIYKTEQNDGINLTNNASVVCQVQLGEKANIFDDTSIADLMSQFDQVQTVEQLLGQDQPDLSLIVAIMVSTGWNKNDDIFLPEEVWKARNSPLHKPLNDNHDARRILGHIVKSRAIDKFGNEVELGEGEAPPAEFDIEVAGVLYKAFPELSGRIEEIIAKAKIGEMFVSVEAWFTDFNYGIVDSATGSTKIIERTEKTAFLTKYLRAYSGIGEYRGYRIGRVLKNILFGAQGFVEKPANPESVIKVAANQMVASNVFEDIKLSEIPEGGVESMEKELKELQEKLDQAEASLKSKEAELVDVRTTLAELQEKNLETQVEELTTKIAEASNRVEVVEGDKEKLQKAFDEATARAEKVEMELTEIRKNEAARNRLTKLSEVKTIVDEDATLAELREMTDETFATVLKYAGEIKVEKSDNKDDTTGKDVIHAEIVLDNVEPENSADFIASDDVEQSEVEQWLATAQALCGRSEEEKD